jgi:hypothetical protein
LEDFSILQEGEEREEKKEEIVSSILRKGACPFGVMKNPVYGQEGSGRLQRG